MPPSKDSSFTTHRTRLASQSRSELRSDFMLSEKHAISILKKDHETVKELFDRFEKTDSAAEKEKIIARAVMELKIHATIEEEIFTRRCARKSARTL